MEAKITDFEAFRQKMILEGAEGKLKHRNGISMIEYTGNNLAPMTCTVTEPDSTPMVFKEFIVIGFDCIDGKGVNLSFIANTDLPNVYRASETLKEKTVELMETASTDEKVKMVPLILESLSRTMGMKNPAMKVLQVDPHSLAGLFEAIFKKQKYK